MSHCHLFQFLTYFSFIAPSFMLCIQSQIASNFIWYSIEKKEVNQDQLKTLKDNFTLIHFCIIFDNIKTANWFLCPLLDVVKIIMVGSSAFPFSKIKSNHYIKGRPSHRHARPKYISFRFLLLLRVLFMFQVLTKCWCSFSNDSKSPLESYSKPRYLHCFYCPCFLSKDWLSFFLICIFKLCPQLFWMTLSIKLFCQGCWQALQYFCVIANHVISNCLVDWVMQNLLSKMNLTLSWV